MLCIDKYRKKSPAKQAINKVLRPCFQVEVYNAFYQQCYGVDFIVYLRCEMYMPGGLR